MSGLENTPSGSNLNPNLLPDYTQPQLQRPYEEKLIVEYGAAHPEELPLLEAALKQLHVVSAGAPAYLQEAGFSAAGAPEEITDTNIRLLQEDEGYVVAGEMPPPVKDLLEGLYGLIGARITNREDDTIIREGRYAGRPVLIEETHQGGLRRRFSVRFVPPSMVKAAETGAGIVNADLVARLLKERRDRRDWRS